MVFKVARKGGTVVGVFALFAMFGFVAASAPWLGDQQRSGSFWNAIAVEGMAAPDYESLEELVAASDLAVVGRMTRVDPGREWLAAPDIQDAEKASMAVARFATITIAVESVVLGSAPGAKVDLEVFLPYADALGELKANRPEGRALFFLHEKQEPGLENVYRLVSDTGAYFLDDGGKAAAPELDESLLATELTGQSFTGLQDRVKALAASRTRP